MKASLQIEYTIAMLMLILLITFVTIQFFGLIPSINSEIRTSQLEAKALSYSDSLVNDLIVSEPYILDLNKINSLKNSERTKVIIRNDDYWFETEGNPKNAVGVERRALLNGEVTKINVIVW